MCNDGMIIFIRSTQEAYDTDKMATDFTVSFQSLPFTIGQPVCAKTILFPSSFYLCRMFDFVY